jgi:hypothetical protein
MVLLLFMAVAVGQEACLLLQVEQVETAVAVLEDFKETKTFLMVEQAVLVA